MYGRREEERNDGRKGRGGGHLTLHLLEKNLWGQPIKGWVTPLSSQLQLVNPAPQDNPRASAE